LGLQDADRFPLHSAAYHGDDARVRAILEGSEVPEQLVLVQDDGGSTALHKAAGNGRLRCIEVVPSMHGSFDIILNISAEG